jgi:hypothetical protein
MVNCRHVLVALAALLVAPNIAVADTYTSVSFSGAINGGSANVKPPFSGHGFTQGDPISGSFVFDNQLVPSSGSGFTNVFFSNFPDIAEITPATALSITLDSLHFTLADNITSQLPAGIQYNNGAFNGLEFITNFAFMGSEYQFALMDLLSESFSSMRTVIARGAALSMRTSTSATPI